MRDSLKELDELCDQIDASVFSGELLYIDAERELLKTYVERWQRAITNHEENESNETE